MVQQQNYQSLEPLQQRQRLWELAIAFFKLGIFAFGGPAAHIAMMDDEMVKRRQWLSREKFLDLIGITNLIPGPNSTEVAIHIGYERGAWWGLLISGCCFILPATLIVWGLAIVYVQSQSLPQVGWLLYGVKPVIIAIVLQALWKLGKTAIKDRPTAIATFLVVLFSWWRYSEILLLLLAGLGVMLIKNRRSSWFSAGLPIPLLLQIASPSTLGAMSSVNIFLTFLKIGSVLYGSGYVLLAFLQREFVERSPLLTSQQILDAVAIGQITPGPIFTTATFVGYLLGGNGGAIAATVGIFLPAFVFVALINPWIDQLRQSSWVSGFLDGVNAASLGLMAVVTVQLGQSGIVDIWTGAIALISGVLLLKFKVNSAALVMGGAIIGLLLHLIVPSAVS
ncbi:MAG: chromate transporter [Timaviella obliquedivisa GSE-PSE-MK23-08B]|jgi:chromate transporter|nr:chromate transporter [Timaviella obliquedivisa GSE-PSE-MK23-08B]